MGIKQSFFLAVKSLLTSKVRALLTMLGIIIGSDRHYLPGRRYDQNDERPV